MSGLRLYGVVRAGTKPPARTTTVVHHDVAAVVGELTGPELTEENATEHLDVLCSLVTETPVVPLRFGTVAPDEDAVRDEVLASGHDDFVAMLDALDGKVEVRVTLAFDEQRMLRDTVAESTELRAAAGGSRELADRMAIGEAAVRELTARVQAQGEQLVAPLLAVADSATRVGSEEPATDAWAFLVDLDHLSTMDELVARLGTAESGAEITYFGPLPALTFAGAAAPPPREQGSRWGW